LLLNLNRREVEMGAQGKESKVEREQKGGGQGNNSAMVSRWYECSEQVEGTKFQG
jgi:hypothetical protein